MLRRVLVALALLVVAADLRAQVGSGPRGLAAEPTYWVGLSYGYVDGMTLQDGATGTTWQFGYTSQIRATFEKTLQRGVSAGLSAGFANGHLTYSTPAFDAACSSACDATADVTQYLAFVHGGAGEGFHGIYELEAGFTEFSNFRDAATDTPLAPTDPRYDFTFGLGGGLGYTYQATTELYVTEQLDLVMHPQGSATNTSAPRVNTFRAGFRIGF